MTTINTSNGKTVSKLLGVEILRAVKDPRTPVGEFVRLSRLAAGEGATETARALLARAHKATPCFPGQPKVSTEVPRGTVVTPSGRSHPADEAHGEIGRTAAPAAVEAPGIPNVTDEQFERFAGVLSQGRALGAEDKGRVGMYGFSVRRLCDLDLCENPRKTNDGNGGAWQADWPRVPKEKFLSSPAMQARALKVSAREHSRTVSEKYSKALGRKVSADTSPITLSGMLAVAHLAGEQGLESWLRDPKVREKFPGTTKLFKAANGIF